MERVLVSRTLIMRMGNKEYPNSIPTERIISDWREYNDGEEEEDDDDAPLEDDCPLVE